MSVATAPHPTPGSIARSVFWWFQDHRKIRWALLFTVVCTACYLFNTGAVWADTEAESTAATFFLPLAGVTDTHGVPISRYTELPMDPGNGVGYVLRSARYFVASMFWAFYSLPVLLVIALVDWILGFEWLTWLSAPFVTVSEGVSGVLEAWMIIPLGLMVSALVIGIGYVRGRTGAATVEFVMIVLVFGFIASSFANPLTWLGGSGDDAGGNSGLIQEAADAGSEAGVLALNQDADPSDSTVAGSVIDITLRNPLLSMSFGSTLDGECETRWNDNAADPSNDTEDIREEVIRCSDEVADANQTDGFGWLSHYILAWPAMIGIMALIGVFLVFLILQVVQVFISAVVAVIRGFMAVFPGHSRQALLNSLFQILVSIVLIGVYIFALTIYMWVVNAIVDTIPPGVTQIGSILVGIVVLIMAITFWKMKKAGKSIGERMAKALGRTGLAKDSPERKPSRFGSTTGNLAKSAAKQGLRMHNNGRMVRAATTATRAATTAAAVGTGGVGGVAAKVGTGMAAKAATTRAMTAASRGAAAAGGAGAAASAAAGPAQMGPGGRPVAGLPAGRSATGLPSGQSAAQLPAGKTTATPEPVGGISAPAGSENAPSSPLPPVAAAPGSPQPLGGIPAPAGSENAPSSPLPPRGVAPTTQASSTAQAGMNTGGGVPAPTQPSTMGSRRVSHIPAGNYGGTWVHKNGQTHRPVTVTPEGAPVRNVPSEEKINRGFQSGDSWVISSGVKPSGVNSAGSRRPSPQQRPASPAQSPGATQTPTEARPSPRPMQTRTEETPTRASRRAKPAAPAPAPTPTQAEGPQNRPAPRSMQPRGSEARRPKGGTE